MSGNVRFMLMPLDGAVYLTIAYGEAETTERFKTAMDAGKRILKACEKLDKERKK